MKNFIHNTNPLAPIAEYAEKTNVLSAGKKANSLQMTFLKVAVLFILFMSLGAVQARNLRDDGNGSIVLIGDDLTVTADGESPHITRIRIYSGSTLVADYAGCNLSSCQHGVSLDSGTYTVVVYASSGNFSGPITVE